MNKKRKNVITKAKILPNKFIGKISPKNREKFFRRKTFYFMLYITSFQKTKKFIEFGILRSIIL